MSFVKQNVNLYYIINAYIEVINGLWSAYSVLYKYKTKTFNKNRAEYKFFVTTHSGFNQINIWHNL